MLRPQQRDPCYAMPLWTKDLTTVCNPLWDWICTFGVTANADMRLEVMILSTETKHFELCVRLDNQHSSLRSFHHAPRFTRYTTKQQCINHCNQRTDQRHTKLVHGHTKNHANSNNKVALPVGRTHADVQHVPHSLIPTYLARPGKRKTRNAHTHMLTSSLQQYGKKVRLESTGDYPPYCQHGLQRCLCCT